MKKSDIAMIVFIASISMIIAFFVARSVFPTAYAGPTKVKTIQRISPSITEPRSDIFNKNAINPAVKVQIIGTQ